MATFTNTDRVDNLFGKTDVADLFLLNLGFVTGDLIRGGDGAVTDVAELQGGGVVPTTFGQNTTGIELIRNGSADGFDIDITNKLVQTAENKRLKTIGNSGNDIIDGTTLAANSPLLADGSFGNDTIRGGKGNDSILGGGGEDTIVGGAGTNTVNGGTDDDLIIAGLQAATLLGGAGQDRFRILFAELFDATSAFKINGNTGIDTVVLGAPGEYDFDARVSNIDSVVLTTNVAGIKLNFSNAMILTAAAPTLSGVEVDFAVNFRRGVFIDASDVTINKGLRIGRFAEDPLNNGNDSIIGGAGADLLKGRGGNDVISGGGRNDILEGGTGFDVLEGGAGTDNVGDAGGGARFVIAQSSHFIAPFDRMFGSGQRVTTDEIALTNGGTYDLANAMSNIDKILFDQLAARAFNVTASAATADANKDGVTGDLHVAASGKLAVGVNIKVVSGALKIANPLAFAGNDTIEGGGIDTINSGAGNDVLTGGFSADVITGGSGFDLFRYISQFDSQQSSGQIDTVTDFTGVDRVDLRPLDLQAIQSAILIKPDGAFATALDPFFFSGGSGQPIHAVAIQSDGVNTRVYINTQNAAAFDPNGGLGSDMVVQFAKDVLQHLDHPTDYLF